MSRPSFWDWLYGKIPSRLCDWLVNRIYRREILILRRYWVWEKAQGKGQ